MPNINWMSFALGVLAVYVFRYVTTMMATQRG